MQSPPVLLEAAQSFAQQNRYVEVQFVGRGAFKETFRVKNLQGEIRALKLSDASKCNPLRTDREIKTLQKCNTPLISKLFESGTHKYKELTCFFSLEEYLDGGTLTDQIQDVLLPKQVTLGYAITLVSAVAYLMNVNIVHRDIKPDNIMFRRGNASPVLVDLGIARDLSGTSITQTWQPTGVGTPLYSAPEQLNNDKGMIDWRTDQFSLGIVLGICFTGYHPFYQRGASLGQIVDNIAQRRYCSSEFCAAITELGLPGLLKMIEPWPIKRAQSPDELIQIFKGG
jgi:serine/threonine protein kinase